ncbi:MAG: M28 family peptidase [Gammaproteobacteria bacterium]|nr:M28 family peptidase [Pseudomonadales bacterium]MCP5347959.1 M28 family peptidase [Pseudomonadales bacterium]
MKSTLRSPFITVLSIALTTGLTVTSISAYAQDNPLGQPLLDERGYPIEEAYIHIPLRADDQQYGDIEGLWMKEVLMELDQISLDDKASGTQFWGRNLGTEAHAISQDWAERYFQQLGLQDISRKTFELAPVWQLNSWSIGFASNGEFFALESARPPEKAESTPPGGLSYELVWLGQGSEADYLGRDVKDKAVLIQDVPLPGTLRHTIQLEDSVDRAYAHGASAVGIVYGISDNFAVWQRTPGPGFNLGYQDGVALRERLGSGETITVTLNYDSELLADKTGDSVLGVLPGATDENVIILSHIDGYFQAASDNGSGMAVMMGLIKHFAAIPQSQRQRNLIFMSSLGHHSGPGARWLVEEANALDNTALVINLEHVAIVRTKYWGPKLRMMNAVSPMRWWVWGSQPLLDIVLDAFQRFNVGVTADMETGASGEMGRVARAIPSLQVITSPEIKHTEQDTPEWVPAVGLEQIGRAYARIIDGVNELSLDELQPEL